jgi:hypothetical protein
VRPFLLLAPAAKQLVTPLFVAVRLYIFISEMHGSNVGLIMFTLAELFCGLPQSLPAIFGKVARFDHDCFLLNPLTFINRASIEHSKYRA